MEHIVALLKPIYDALGLIFFSFFGGIIRTIYRPSSRKLSAYFLSVIVSVPIGVLAGNIGMEYGLTENTSKALAVVAGILAHDIIESVFWASDKIKSERDSLLSGLIKKFVRDESGGGKDV